MKKTVYNIIFILVIGTIFFCLIPERKIKNFPSTGTDIVAFGDSLIKGVGSTKSNDFVSLLSKKIGRPIINLGHSGDTTEDGLQRIEVLDEYNPKVVILLLGGNDYLRKVPIEETRENLIKLIKNIQDRGAVVLLLGVRGGLIYDGFSRMFGDLSRKYETAYVSDVLSGLLLNTNYMSDAIHPNDLGYEIIAKKIEPVLVKLLK